MGCVPGNHTSCAVGNEGVLSCSTCADRRYSDIVYAHRKQRIYIGPGSNEIVIDLGRLGVNPGLSDQEMVLTIYKPAHSDMSVDIISYAMVDDGTVHFNLTDSAFLTDAEKYPKGFYKAKIRYNNCVVDEIEIVKAPSFFVDSADAKENRCHGTTGFVEPDCTTPDDSASECECECGELVDGCPTCLKKKLTAKNNVKKEYLSTLDYLE